ncbi:MAG: hydrogenase maturation protein [Burkholderiales bacterium]|nr:hydrogenase maturation protein [Burkholderiales bacterium]
MRILLLAHSYNCLTQSVHCALTAAGHDVSIEFDIADSVTEEAVALWRPELVIAPFLKRRIPESVWRRHRCLVVHPGIAGDRGPSALDWAISEGVGRWGVTILEANGDMDAGDVWASVEFPMRDAAKSSLYRQEVTAAAVAALTTTLAAINAGGAPKPLADLQANARGRLRPLMKQADRAIDWRRDDTATVLRRIRAADGAPGVADAVLGIPVRLYGAHREGNAPPPLAGATAGAVVAQRSGAILRATVDGGVWITHLQRIGDDGNGFKLPAAQVLGDRLAEVPELALAPDARVDGATWRPIEYVEEGAVGYLHFPFHNGAMGTADCEALRAAYVAATRRATRVIVLMGGPDFWSNGIHLNLIEAAEHPAEESWRNINAMNDLVREIIMTSRQLTIAAMQGNAGAGGAFLALAADRVWARDAVILNAHYKGMGNLYGSEYWTYLLPRRVGDDAARALTQGRLPMTARAAVAAGLIDAQFGADPEGFRREVERRAQALAAAPDYEYLLAEKARSRAADEAHRPLAAYRAAELERMHRNFFGFDPSYHVARFHFVGKVPRSRTPLYLARHRSGAAGAGRAAQSVAAAV